MLKKISVLLMLAVMVAACSQSTSPSGTTATYIQTKSGSTFTFDEYATDTTTGLPVPGTRDTAVQTVLQTGMTYMGKTNVTKIHEISPSVDDTIYINYETNHDVSVFEATALDTEPVWNALPTGSKSSNSITSDTTVSVFGVPVETKISQTIAYLDNETMTVNGNSIGVSKLSETVSFTTISAGTSSTQSSLGYFYYAPSLGFIARTEQPVQAALFGNGKAEGPVSTLINYSLK